MAPKAKKEESAKKADEAKKTDAVPKVEKDSASGDAKPQKPNEEEFQKRLDAVKEKIDKLKAAQEKLNTEINSKNTGMLHLLNIFR